MSASALFDLPGPKARMRYRIYAVAGTLLIAGAIAYVIYRFIDAGQFKGRLWEWLEYEKIQTDLLRALGNTLTAFALAALFSLVFGAVFAAGRLSDHAIIRVPSMLIVELFRAIPAVILMFIFHYGIQLGDPFNSVVLALMFYNGSVLAEVFRAGILSLPRGQSEAAYALGMRKTQVMILVLLPQALRAMLPTIVSQLVVVLKDTALGFLITYEELLYYARNLGGVAQFGRPLIPVTIVVAAMYITMCLLLAWLANYLSKRERRSKKHIEPEGKGPVAEDSTFPVTPVGSTA
ncbi:glutamate transport system permease protein [Kibdelosporangium banguiense]|uniref:Glutamate transport system permease protein n=1 Tax=Kibdelosporangium banguiense TaxID=1365924 RepID=A0ABS4U2Z0_9PSEU|nr:amino acid ABC transporter permease [Kibdelosporangium banguiense]MBP2331034.1 glutamate transport system permease protein [Kibdelosporangium banguiense]